MGEQLTNLEQLLDRLDEAAEDREDVSLGTMLEVVGSRSLGPLLLLAGIITVSPLSGIPGLPTFMATIVLFVATQILVGRDHIWLPNLILKRSVSRGKLKKALKWLRRPSRAIDRWVTPRMTVLTGGPARYVIAVICIVIGLGMPFMEIIPFSASAAGATLAAFGLSLIACDGLLASFAFFLTAFVFGLVAYNVF